MSSHPLKEIDDRECYDILMRERTLLISAKRESENELIRTLVKLSSAAALIVPGVIFSSDGLSIPEESKQFLFFGIIAFVMSLIFALTEQFFSSLAYNAQTRVTIKFYQKESEEIESWAWSRTVFFFWILAFVFFIIGVSLCCFAFYQGGEL